MVTKVKSNMITHKKSDNSITGLSELLHALILDKVTFTSTEDFADGVTTLGTLSDADVLALQAAGTPIETIGFYPGSTTGSAKYKFLNLADSTAQGYVAGYSRFQIRSLDVYACLVVENGEIRASSLGVIYDTIDGTVDNSTAINAALLLSNNKKIDLTNSTLPAVVSRDITQPILTFENGIVAVQNPINIFQSNSWLSVNIKSEGLGCFIYACDSEGAVDRSFNIIEGNSDTLYPGFKIYIEGLKFIGGQKHIRIKRNNINTSEIKLKNISCMANHKDFYAIDIDARSTIMSIDGLMVKGCQRFLKLNHVDKCSIDDYWISGANYDGLKDEDSASFSLQGEISTGPSRLHLKAGLLIPQATGTITANGTRWVDLRDDCSFIADGAHFGLENGGYPIVYTYTPLDSVTVSPYVSDSAVILNNCTGGSGSATRADRGIVVLKTGIPHNIDISNTCRIGGSIIINATQMIDDLGDPITASDYISSLTGNYTPILSINIDGVSAFNYNDLDPALQPFAKTTNNYWDSVHGSSNRSKQSNIVGVDYSVDDESSINITLPSTNGICIITSTDTISSTKTGNTAIFSYNSQISVGRVDEISTGAFCDIAAYNTNLTGSAGVNGNFTVSVSDGSLLQIENRLGFSSKFSVLYINTSKG